MQDRFLFRKCLRKNISYILTYITYKFFHVGIHILYISVIYSYIVESRTSGRCDPAEYQKILRESKKTRNTVDFFAELSVQITVENFV